jgi:predicted O-methyltransferase YrrM
MGNSALNRAGYPDIALPAWRHVSREQVHGRFPLDGYQRSIKVTPSQIEQTMAHPLFQEARRVAHGRTLVTRERLANIFLILSVWFDQFDSKNCIEFGSYRGGSTLFMATILARLYEGAKVYAFDTFEGMPATDKTLDLHKKGDFSDVSLDEIEQTAKSLNLDNIVFVKGMVEDTFPAKIADELRFGLAHIDLDIYQPIRYCQNEVWDRLEAGGYLVYDDATAPGCLGATQAVEEFIHERDLRSEQIYPHFVFRRRKD